MEPRELAAWAHATFGHGTLDLAESLVVFDDSYDTLDYLEQTREEVDAEVRAEARRILGPDRLP
ncbi:hypothetical protein [Actinophytocola sp.]|uniref:hypothetical protein n=1 Tax=Actinophytocola sp. TaxID=1872138 RepID=UPI002D804676|nr:hypothetical protein [Actinophytocola sp.]HET9143783.1 hypothetical protein [Actinophytocola sp.]